MSCPTVGSMTTVVNVDSSGRVAGGYGLPAPPLLPPLISLAAGSLLSVTFLDLLPEALAEGQIEAKIIFGITLISILFFFSFERILHWHHCRCEEEGKKHSQIKKNLYHPGFLLMFWYFFGLIGLGLYKQHIYDHYFGFLFPVF